MTDIPKSRLYALPTGLVYITKDARKQETRRHAATILASLEDEPVEVVIDGAQIRGHSILIKPGAQRTLTQAPPGLLSINIDPWHPEFQRFRGWQHSQSAFALDLGLRDTSPSLLDRCQSGCEQVDDVVSLFEFCADRVTRLMPETPSADRRVLSVIDRINATEPDLCQFADLAEHAGVSENHLSHIFTDNLGISMRSLRLWHKLRLAMKRMVGLDTLTTIAHDCGFSDSAHFSRSFHTALGLKPSFIADRKHVDLHLCG
ncbi:MAG: helix-turn-helix domain-containing protein [Pseudomonadota bacterium]